MRTNLGGTMKVSAEETYTVRLRYARRKRKPPKREPNWITDIPGLHYNETDRTGLGATLPDLLSAEKLAAILDRCRVRAAEAGEEHVIVVVLYLMPQDSTVESKAKLLARWDCWSQRWQADTVSVQP